LLSSLVSLDAHDEPCSLIGPHETVINIGAEVIIHSRHVMFQLAEVAVSLGCSRIS
jgi:hypothetical protein